MNTDSLHDLLWQTKSLLHISATGAGPGLQFNLWGQPGCSEYLVGFFTPYAKTQLHSFLGHEPDDSYVSESVAYDLAMASYIRSAEHKSVWGGEGNPVGVGITASVASNRIPRGEQRAHICVITQNMVLKHKVPLHKGEGRVMRIQHDAEVTRAATLMLTQALTKPWETPETHQEALDRFYRYPVFNTNGTRLPRTSGGEGAVYLPATLNPIHDGHRSMAATAEEQLSPSGPGRIQVSYLVSSSSPHKGRLTVQEMLDRAGMLRAERWKGQSRAVEFTHDEPLFIDKARRRPGSVFLIGADTMERMLDPKWGPEVGDMLQEMKNLGCKFLVMGRVMDGKFKTCRDFRVPWPHGNLFDPLGGRVDISSSELRAVQA
jgi:nicotinic acid mononucleotide adenylyltransferase